MKLNKKGYMLAEVIISSIIAMSISFFLLNLTLDFKNKNEDIYESINYTNKKNLITKNIMNDLKDSDVTITSCSSNSVSLTANYGGEVKRKKLEISNNKLIYGNYNSTYNKTDSSYYEKELNSLIIGSIDCTSTNGFTIPISSMYSDDEYNIHIFLAK